MSVISTEALIAKFQQALEEEWGYIWGTAGDFWTDAKQQNLVNKMVAKYGSSWKKDADAKSDSLYKSAADGSKWVGHYVADCSGLFSWAFKKLNGYVAHGSNTIYRSYCTNKGKLSKGKRTDGKTLLPGTAVFVYKEQQDNYSHIGLFIGHGKVIEASGVDAGVCVSNLSASKWTYWGELKGVNYTSDTGFPTNPTWHATIRRGSKGEDVTYVQNILSKLGYDLGSYGVDGDFGKATEKAVKEFQSDHKLTVDGVVGPMTYDALDKAYASQTDTPTKYYSVTIRHLTKEQAESVLNNYPGSVATEE